MVHTPTSSRLGEIIAAEFERAGITSLRQAEETVGIKRLTLARRLESGDFRTVELEQIAAALRTTPSALLALAEAAA